MKPYLTYGAFIAIGNAAITLVLYLAGFHTDPAKFQTGNYIAGAARLAIGISLLVVGIRAKYRKRRNSTTAWPWAPV